MKITRRFTQQGRDPFSYFEYEKRSSQIRSFDGKTIFSMDNVIVPKHWSQLATDILAEKYFRKTGVPQRDDKGEVLLDDNGLPLLGSENSIKQVVHRIVGTWTDWGKRYGYFDSEDDVSAFYDEITYTFLNQMCSPNSPQWFNTGLS